uniref:NAD(P)(+)--arginine ADP-ribosyltransferase n=1 Tax=Neogobius melanostomus TaxID=47308 RepID=A0A8C6SCB4_9GOBI
MEAIILTFVLCLTLPIAATQGPQHIELGMMAQCIDDKFAGCFEPMSEKVQEVYFPREIQNSPFRNAWNQAEPCANRNLDMLPDEDRALTKDHLQAVCVYTNATTKMFAQLNEQVRNGAVMYDTPAFQYHALYYWLATAIDILGKSCEITYKRTPNVYGGKVGTTMRFGYFASSSRSPFVVEYGSETCFHIKTCSGGYIGDYSVVPSEEEVLIPSYEEFRITDVVADSYGEFKCKKIFLLESVGNSSELNCKAANHNQDLIANFALIVGFQLLIGMLWNYENYIFFMAF